MIIKVKVKPNSKNSKIMEKSPNEFIAYVKSPPLKGKANKELIDLLSKYFKIPKSRIEIIKGLKSRDKIIKIDEV